MNVFTEKLIDKENIHSVAEYIDYICERTDHAINALEKRIKELEGGNNA